MERVYLDHAAATPLRPEVRDAMEPHHTGIPGNASSIHSWGRSARVVLERAREKTAHLLRVHPDEIRFTRGGTESNNLAILGRAAKLRLLGEVAPAFARSALEHSSVREPLNALAEQGCRVTSLDVAPDGSLQLPPNGSPGPRGFGLASVQWVNQETGMILPVDRALAWCREEGAVLHIDAAQAAGRVPIDLERIPASLVTVSGHKLGGPSGTGVLVVRTGTEITPILFGGKQERGLRPGTEDVAGAAGFAAALEVSLTRLPAEASRLATLRDRLEAGLLARISGLRILAGEAPRAPHILGIGVPGIPRDVLPGALDLEGVGTSAGSACRSGSLEVSPVLAALYPQDANHFAPLRLSLGWTTTARDVQIALERIVNVVERMSEAGVRS